MEASSSYEVSVESASPRSFWRKLFFSRLNIEANLAAEAVQRQSGGPAPSAFAGPTRIVVRNRQTGAEVWHADTADLSGGTTPEQVLDDVEHDLDLLDVDVFRTKYGIRND